MEPGQGSPAARKGHEPEPLPAPAASDATINLEDFQRLALRVGTVLSAQEHPNADRLLVLKVDLGEVVPRQLVAGIRAAYKAEELVGKQVVVVANLKSALLRGVESQGMVLAASNGASLVLLTPERPIAVGSTVK